MTSMRKRHAKSESNLVGRAEAIAKSDRQSSRPGMGRKNQSTATSPEDILADSQLYKEERPFYKRKRFHFIIGVSVGVLAALGGLSTTPTAQTHLSDLQTYLALQLADIDLTGMMPATEVVDELFGNVTNFFKPAPSSDVPFMPAIAVKDELDLKPHFPVVLIPGIISSGLESWGTHEKSQKYFRKRMWGTTTMFRSVLLDKESWTSHLKLDPETGLDPPDVRIRAAQGLDAADYFVSGYWVWARIIENLAAIGYDSNNIHLASYDWRLSFSNLEVRDKYFTKLKATIETAKAREGRKSVIVSHSMGSLVFHYFLKWVESPRGGNAGPDWTENHIESLANIAGPMIGVPKALTAMLSGETRDTMALGSFGAYLLEKFFSRRERAALMRTWAGGSSMLPKGGNLFWGDYDSAPDDPLSDDHHSFGNILSFTNGYAQDEDSQGLADMADDPNDPEYPHKNYTVDTSFKLLFHNAPKEYQDQVRLNYSLGIDTSKKQLAKNDDDPTKWSNPLQTRLPNAPSMKIYCLYGVGLPTERSYYYARSPALTQKCEQGGDCSNVSKADGLTPDQAAADALEMAVDRMPGLAATLASKANDTILPPNMFIDPNVHDPVKGVETGVRFSDGDGTVPVLSLGYMCTESGGWRKHADLYNPANIPVLIKEYQHEQSDSKLDVRGGKKAGDHIDILGNWDMTLDILQIVSGKGHNVTERIFSDIERYASKIDVPR